MVLDHFLATLGACVHSEVSSHLLVLVLCRCVQYMFGVKVVSRDDVRHG
jgi:hypothetical protein